MSDFIVAYVTVSSEAEGAKIARSLIEENLAACVNIVPNVHSFYQWQGEMQQDKELLLIIKSQGIKMSSLVQRVKDLHSYDVPEVISMPISDGSRDYLNWVRKETE